MEPEIAAAFIGAGATLVTTWPISYWLNRKLERYKTQLGAATEELRGTIALHAKIAELRLANYPRLSKLLSEVMKGLRKVVTGSADQTDWALLRLRIEELEDSLYSSQLQLQRDGIHADVHGYKNGAMTLLQLVANREIHYEQGEDDEAAKVTDELDRLAAILERTYPEIRQKMASRLDDLGYQSSDGVADVSNIARKH